MIKNIAKRRLSAALRDWQACELPQEYYMMQNASGDDATRVNIGSKRIF